ncbi:growth arrest-specific protein 1-like protein [Leptotrombidium deliense]|uniref:Growth arrest-specific protein 1-like protein n=1 Tax=Leptotrombidium deliense TaxID=299467 RepID=A0A443S8M2_9ACAR|nr:growth arrest-specific protein 1-like protein [Leptotrombidium deliense]
MDCGIALHSYMVDCADLITGRTTVCPVLCQKALIALMSTEKGQELMNCDCDGSKFCQLNKDRVEVCRPAVIQATAEGSNVSCSTARWICLADYQCSTALDYYNTLCRGLFYGRRCTARCNNSLSILNRQQKAAKLRTCYCDGSEDFPCQVIKENTEKLCFRNEPSVDANDEENEIKLFDTSDASVAINGNTFVNIVYISGLIASLVFT